MKSPPPRKSTGDHLLPPPFTGPVYPRLSPKDTSSKPRVFVYLLNATNNICFYFCAGPSPAADFFKSGAPMTNGWMDHRAEARGGRERRAGYSGQIIVKGRERAFCPPAATLFLIKGVLYNGRRGKYFSPGFFKNGGRRRQRWRARRGPPSGMAA